MTEPLLLSLRVREAAKRAAKAVEGMQPNEAITALAALTGSILYAQGQGRSPRECREMFDGHVEQIRMAIAANIQHEMRNPTPPLIIPAR